MAHAWHLTSPDARSWCMHLFVLNAAIWCFGQEQRQIASSFVPLPKPTPSLPTRVTMLPPIVRSLLVIFSFSILRKCAEISVVSDVTAQSCN